MTLATTSEASTAREGWNREQEGTFNHHLNQKIMLSKLNDDSSTNDLWMWLAAYRYVNSGCSVDALKNEVNRSLLNGFWGVWFCLNHMLGDSILTALNKMKQTDHHQHSDGLLQEFYAMTQKHKESIGKYAVRLDMAAGKVWLQSQEALGSTPDECERLLVNHLLQSMNPKLQARVAHVVDSKGADQRPAYYDLIKFAVQKKAEINFDEAKKTRDSSSKLKATIHFHFNHKKSRLPTTPAVQMVSPAPEEGSGNGETTSPPGEESDSGKSYEAVHGDSAISQGDVAITVRVAQVSEAFTSPCFRCNKVGHQFCDEESEMYNPEFLNTWGPAKKRKSWQVPGMKGQSKTTGLKLTR